MTDVDLKQQKVLERIARNNGITIEEAATLGSNPPEPPEPLPTSSPTTYEDAIKQGNRFMELARIAAAEAEDLEFITRLQKTGNRWDHATYLQTRALSCFQLAALLKPV